MQRVGYSCVPVLLLCGRGRAVRGNAVPEQVAGALFVMCGGGCVQCQGSLVDPTRCGRRVVDGVTMGCSCGALVSRQTDLGGSQASMVCGRGVTAIW